jgi:hypothetical protein
LPPKSQVQAAGITVTGNTASVSGATITVGGRTLNSLMLIGSHNAAGSSLKVSLLRQNGRWLIGNLGVNFGTSSAAPTPQAS